MAVPEDSLLDLARFLGILDSEPELFWIAERASLEPLPAGWEEIQSDKGAYYYEYSTGTSTWDHPLDIWFKKLVIEVRQQNAVQTMLRELMRQAAALHWRSKAQVDFIKNHIPSFRSEVDETATWFQSIQQTIAPPTMPLPQTAPPPQQIQQQTQEQQQQQQQQPLSTLPPPSSNRPSSARPPSSRGEAPPHPTNIKNSGSSRFNSNNTNSSTSVPVNSNNNLNNHNINSNSNPPNSGRFSDEHSSVNHFSSTTTTNVDSHGNPISAPPSPRTNQLRRRESRKDSSPNYSSSNVATAGNSAVPSPTTTLLQNQIFPLPALASLGGVGERGARSRPSSSSGPVRASSTAIRSLNSNIASGIAGGGGGNEYEPQLELFTAAVTDDDANELTPPPPHSATSNSSGAKNRRAGSASKRSRPHSANATDDPFSRALFGGGGGGMVVGGIGGVVPALAKPLSAHILEQQYERAVREKMERSAQMFAYSGTGVEGRSPGDRLFLKPLRGGGERGDDGNYNNNDGGNSNYFNNEEVAEQASGNEG